MTPIAAIVVLFLFDWRMGLLCLLTMVLALLSMCMMMGGKNAGFFHRYQQEIERMSGEAVEYVRGIPVVKMFQQTVYSLSLIHIWAEYPSPFTKISCCDCHRLRLFRNICGKGQEC